jgi:hypothetical protein
MIRHNTIHVYKKLIVDSRTNFIRITLDNKGIKRLNIYHNSINCDLMRMDEGGDDTEQAQAKVCFLETTPVSFVHW